MKARKIIFESRVGSHLYGTNTPASDEDYRGVYLPSTEDLLGVQSAPGEWDASVKTSDGARNAAGDVDRKFYSIKKFIDLACQGQPGQLEMMFAPVNMVLLATPEWDAIQQCRNMFISKTGIKPFLGFATSQAHKAAIKGENLILIRELIKVLADAINRQSRVVVSDLMSAPTDGKTVIDGQVTVTHIRNDRGFTLIEVAGRQFDSGLLCKSLLESLKSMESRYGTRSDAAAAKGYDYKSLSHAVRLISEAEEFLLRGTLTFPRPDAAFLLQVKRGEIDRDWFGFLFGEIERLEQDVLPQSQLTAQPNRSALNQLCIDILTRHVVGV